MSALDPPTINGFEYQRKAGLLREMSQPTTKTAWEYSYEKDRMVSMRKFIITTYDADDKVVSIRNEWRDDE